MIFRQKYNPAQCILCIVLSKKLFINDPLQNSYNPIHHLFYST